MANDGDRTTRLLLATRFVRSIGQGALAVDFALYLRALDWSAMAVSAVHCGADNEAGPDSNPSMRSRPLGSKTRHFHVDFYVNRQTLPRESAISMPFFAKASPLAGDAICRAVSKTCAL